MALPVVTPTVYGSAQNKTAAGTVVVTTTSLIPANTLLVMAVCADNVAAATPTISSITAVGGATWANQAGATTQSGATTTAGTGVFVYAQTLFTSSSVASGTAITVTFNASPTAKAVVLVGFAGMSTVQNSVAVSAASTSGVPSVAAGALKYSDVVIGVIGQENSANSTVDTDTTAGSWAIATSLATAGGATATNCAVQVQYKPVNGTSAQTFDPPGGANDAVAIVFPFRLAAAAKIETFTDDFSGDLSKWSVQGTPTISSGRLKLDHLTATAQDVRSSTPLSLTDYSLLESSVYAEVVPAAQPTGTGTAQTNFACVSLLGAGSSAQFNIAQTSSARNLQMLTPTGGPSITQIPYDPVAHRWLRLRHTGGTYFYDTSPDGTTWTNRGSTIPSPSVDNDFGRIYVKLNASQITTNYGESTYVDNVNVVAAAAGGKIKVWSGSAWVEKPVKVWSGSAWVEKPVKVWSGSAWVLS